MFAAPAELPTFSNQESDELCKVLVVAVFHHHFS